MEILFIISFSTSSAKFSKFDAANVILFQMKVFGRNIKEITLGRYFIKVTTRPNLNKEFSSLCEWFIDNKLLVHFGDDKTKTNFSRMKNPPKLNISYGDYSLKQHSTVDYLACYLDCNLTVSQWLVEFLGRLTLS